MSDLVLDTQACLYALASPDRLGAAARRALRQADAGRAVAWIPAAVVAEIVLLREMGRVRIGLPELTTVFETSSAFRFLPLDLRQLDEFSAHMALRDPFDRLIVSACRVIRATLLTKDEALAESGLVRVLWA